VVSHDARDDEAVVPADARNERTRNDVRRGRLRLLAVWAGLAALVAAARPTPVSIVAGLPIVAAGEALRSWAAGHLRKSAVLVTAGPYRFTRNPLYLGRLAIFVGLCLMAPLPAGGHFVVLAAGVAIFFGYYLPRKERVEPARLAALHGERYERYRREVPALWPRPTPWPGSAAGSWSRERFLANREHWMVVGLTLVTALLLWRAAR
jgi:protein-S-isoprenylcysteine O-methyltransferase Ste14